jgi:hypothetical protein
MFTCEIRIAELPEGMFTGKIRAAETPESMFLGEIRVAGLPEGAFLYVGRVAADVVAETWRAASVRCVPAAVVETWRAASLLSERLGEVCLFFISHIFRIAVFFCFAYKYTQISERLAKKKKNILYGWREASLLHCGSTQRPTE